MNHAGANDGPHGEARGIKPEKAIDLKVGGDNPKAVQDWCD